MKSPNLTPKQNDVKRRKLEMGSPQLALVIWPCPPTAANAALSAKARHQEIEEEAVDNKHVSHDDLERATSYYIEMNAHLRMEQVPQQHVQAHVSTYTTLKLIWPGLWPRNRCGKLNNGKHTKTIPINDSQTVSRPGAMRRYGLSPEMLWIFSWAESCG